MRITGGRYKGRRIAFPPGEIRPAMDRMRESMFAILGDLTGFSFLDLFSGSGSVGIEAASRGASPVMLVESDGRKRKILTQNASIVETVISLRFSRAERFIKSCEEIFDILFLDPPFSYQKKESLLHQIVHSDLLGKDALVLIHHPWKEELPAQTGLLYRFDERRYGQSQLTFYRSTSSTHFSQRSINPPL